MLHISSLRLPPTSVTVRGVGIYFNPADANRCALDDISKVLPYIET
jgi:hypothetical protein